MTDMGTFIGNCIIIVMAVAVLFGNTEDLGYAAIFGIVAILMTLGYKMVFDHEFRRDFLQKIKLHH